jgi:DNA replication protein
MIRRSNGGPSAEALAALLQEGAVAVPLLLLRSYARMQLSDTEALLLIQLMTFVEKERIDFPTIEDLQERMASSPDLVIRALHKLLHDGWISIDDTIDPESGIRSERYNLSGMYGKLAAWKLDEWNEPDIGKGTGTSAGGAAGSDLYSMFEHEFGRPLTPMELETITGWLEQDKHSEALIVAALKEAVFAGKIHFRYVDRILLEWQRNRIQTIEQAREHAQKFRGMR